MDTSTASPGRPAVPAALPSVRKLLAWLVLASMLPGIVGAGLLLWHEYGEDRQMMARDSLLTARALVRTVDSHLLQAQTVAQALATEECLARGNLERFGRRAREVLQETGVGFNLAVLDRSGRQIANLMRHPGEVLPPSPNPEAVLQVFRTGKPLVSDLTDVPLLKRPLVVIYVPVLVRGEVAYALGMALLPEHFSGILQAGALMPSPEWVVTVLDSSGTIVARSRGSERFVGQKATDSFLRAMRQSSDGVMEGPGKDGIPLVTAYARSPATGWRVAVGIPEKEVSGLLFANLRKLLVGMVTLFMVGLGLAWLLGGRIAQAFRALAGPAASLGAGEAVALPPVAVKEAADVMAALGEASLLLQGRTAALQDANRALEASEGDLKRLIADLPGMVWVCGSEGLLQFISRQWIDYTGMDLESQLGMGAIEAIHPDDREYLQRLWQAALAGRGGFHVEFRVRRHDGDYRWFKSRGAPQVDAYGRVVRWLGITVDIHDLKETQEALAASQAELLEAHRLARLGNWHWSAETDEIMGSPSLREVFGRDVPSFSMLRDDLLPSDSWQQVDDATQEALRTGAGYDLEVQAVHASGRPLWIHAKSEVVRNGAGEAIGLRGTVQDITERRQTLDALRASNARFEAVFAQAAVGIARVGLDGRWLEVNDRLCELLGYRREELLEKKFQDVTVADDLDRDLALARNLLEGQLSSYSIEKRYIRKYGSPVWVNLTGSLVRTPCGEPDYFIAVVEDIQPRKEAEAALEKARRTHLLQLEKEVAERTAELREARDNLEARVAQRTKEVLKLAAEVTYAEERERQAIARDLHDDLGQILHVARINLSLLLREKLPADGRTLVEETTGIVGEASRKVRSLTSQLSPPVLTTLGLPAALEWLCAEIGQTYGLTVSCQVEKVDCGLNPAQSAILFRAARELLINAAKHSGSGAASLEFSRAGSAVALVVEDAGCGFADRQAALAGSKGFGLASVRERIAYLGGQMEIGTGATGGARVRLELPVEVQAQPAGVEP